MDRTPDESHARGPGSGPLTYGTYLRVPELLSLQSPLSLPVVRDEMLFIVVQQVQELWFKQLLYDLRAVVAALDTRRPLEALPLLGRATGILRALAEEVAILETMPPLEFQRFRGVLSTSSGFESEQFRELELASGLRDPTFLKVLEKFLDAPALYARWPRTLADAFLGVLRPVAPDPVAAVLCIYSTPAAYPELFLLAEALSDYEVRFQEWRFHHLKLVDRSIGDRAAGTAGSAGTGYLGKTLGYRFFPALWEARNQLTARYNAARP